MLIIKDHLSLVDQEPPDHPDHQRKPVTVKELFPDRRHFDNLLNFKGQKTLPKVCKKRFERRRWVFPARSVITAPSVTCVAADWAHPGLGEV